MMHKEAGESLEMTTHHVSLRQTVAELRPKIDDEEETLDES